MTPQPSRHVSSALAFAALLALIAGCVDAIGFTRTFGVFPANQSGNAVLLGIDVGQGHWGAAWRPSVAIVGFGIGVALAIVVGSRIRTGGRAKVLIVVELAFLAPLAVVLLTLTRPATELSGPATAILLALTSCAMGIQTEVIRRVAGVAVATTYQSGAIARLAESATREASSEQASNDAKSSVTILLVVIAAYIGGAALGSAVGTTRPAMIVPLVLLGVVALPMAVIRPE